MCMCVRERECVCFFGLAVWHINNCRFLMPNHFLNINSSISNNSVLRTKTLLFQAIQLSISTQFSSIWSIDRTLSGATTLGQCRPGSDGNEGELYIPQNFSIAGALPSDCLVSYPGHSLGESYPSAEMQSVYCTAPTDWAKEKERVRAFLFL